jgi:hypothetical protein
VTSASVSAAPRRYFMGVASVGDANSNAARSRAVPR